MTSAAAHTSFKQRINRVLYFFPFRLAILHLKKNHFLLFFWVLLFAFTEGFIGERYGVRDQFLFPEYLGESNFVSFAILGFAMGGFILAFNTYTYILHGFRFPFIVTLNRPFVKFSINNFIIPVLYVSYFLYQSIDYQIHRELLGIGDVLSNIAGLIFGMLFLLIMTSIYFSFTNRNYNSGDRAEEGEAFVQSPLHRKVDWVEKKLTSREWRVETYLQSLIKVSLARESSHYNTKRLREVFSQNHVNASIFEILLVLSFFLIGSFREYDLFAIPAAASVILFFTMMLMIISAIFSYIKGWTITLFIGLFLLVNYSFTRFNILDVPSRAYGLDYSGDLPSYDRTYIYEQNVNAEQVNSDFNHMLQILDNWRLKHQTKNVKTQRKPKLVVLASSGGGLRSAMWTMTSVLTADSIMGGELLDQIFLITGSSGGLIGSAYLRELQLRKKQGYPIDLYDQKYCDAMGKDLLNPVIFTSAVNDFFIRYQKFDDGPYKYTKDRGYAFEQQLMENTGNLLKKRLGDYRLPEFKAQIPVMVMSPTIINDGRRLLISSQPVSYLTQNKPISNVNSNSVPEDVEFSRLFKDQNPNNLRFSSALRMNATFPYITPIVSLPSDPPLEVMDAGLRDNFGLKTTLQFLYTFRNWINTNTSGVILLQTRDIQKDFEAHHSEQSLLNRFTEPLGNVYGNFTKMQDYNHDQMVRYLSAWFENEIDIVTFQLYQDPNSRISLSWHLTEAEKRRIKTAVNSEQYKEALNQLVELTD